MAVTQSYWPKHGGNIYIFLCFNIPDNDICCPVDTQIFKLIATCRASQTVHRNTLPRSPWWYRPGRIAALEKGCVSSQQLGQGLRNLHIWLQFIMIATFRDFSCSHNSFKCNNIYGQMIHMICTLSESEGFEQTWKRALVAAPKRCSDLDKEGPCDHLWKEPVTCRKSTGKMVGMEGPAGKPRGTWREVNRCEI